MSDTQSDQLNTGGIRLVPFVSALLALAVSFSTQPFGGFTRITTEPATVTRARLQVTVTTTSDWSSLAFTAGRVLAHRVATTTGGPAVNVSERGVSIDGPPGATSSAVVNLVYEEPGSLSTLGLRLTKGAAGSTSVKVKNTSATPYDVASFVVGTSVQSKLVSVTRDLLLSRANPSMPPADRRRLVLAAYYPWWGPGAYGDPTLSDRPADRRFTSDAAGVLSMAEQARANGIDGLVMSWAGAQENGAALDLLIDAQERTGGTTSLYLETRQSAAEPGGPPRPAVLKQWIEEGLARSNSAAFLKAGTEPVVFVFEMGALGPPAWQWILDQLAAAGHRVRLVGDALTPNYLKVAWGTHIYNPNFQSIAELTAWNRSFSLGMRLLDSASPSDHAFIATVSPGYDDQALRGTLNPIVARGSQGERYAGTWNAAFAASPEWVFVTSWNEWIEGTHIEPGEETGSLALSQTADFARRFHAPTLVAQAAGAAPFRPALVDPRQPRVDNDDSIHVDRPPTNERQPDARRPSRSPRDVVGDRAPSGRPEVAPGRRRALARLLERGLRPVPRAFARRHG